MKINSFFLFFVISIVTANHSNIQIDHSFEEIISVNIKQIQNDDWFGKDKIKHLSGSFLLTILTYQALENNYNIQPIKESSASIVLGLGITKELIDSKKKNNFFSLKDLAANILGITLGLVVINNYI